MRRGGDQVIPRPPAWQPGGPPPWHAVTAPRIELGSIASALAERGPGRPPLLAIDGARPAAVLVALWDGPSGAEVLLTRRSQVLRSHRGEVSFPGGRVDPGETPLQAALREAHEEVALEPSEVQVIGELDHLSTVVSRNEIVPVVGALAGPPLVHPATAEVDRVFTVPLAELLLPGIYREERWGHPPLDRSVWFFELDDETVWGATARMLVQLLALALGVEDV